MKQINFYNENGKVSSKVRGAIKKQAMPKILNALQCNVDLTDAIVNADGGISIPLATTERGETIYARLEVTISVKNPEVKTERKKRAKKTESTDDDVNIFG